MKIKTIESNNAAEFDRLVNEALEQGYMLGRRFVVRTGYLAELVQLDPPEPEPVDPFEALHQVKEFCLAQPKCEACPLNDWCEKLAQGGDPTDWTLPEVPTE